MTMRAIPLFAVLATLLCYLSCTTDAATLHIDKCDNFCGGSKLNPFGKSGTCKSCCLDKGFYAGGDCGDLLYRHCRCIQNPPGGGQPNFFNPAAAPPYPNHG